MAKRLAAGPLVVASPTLWSAKLRIIVLPPLPDDAKQDAKWSDEQRRQRVRRVDIIQRRHTPQKYRPPPHIVLRAECTAHFYDIVLTLPLAQLALSNFTVTLAADGSTLCQSHSFDSQQALDEAIVSLFPLNTRLHVKGEAAGFDRLLDAVSVSFTCTLTEADGTSLSLLAAITITPTSASSILRQSTVPRLALVDNTSVLVSAVYRLTADLTVSLPAARLGASEKNEEAAEQPRSETFNQGSATEIVFVSGDDARHTLLQSPLPLRHALDHHRQRVLADSRFSSKQDQHSRSSFLSDFSLLYPTVHLKGIVLRYAFDSNQSVRVDVKAQCGSDVQLRGLHIVRPLIRYQLHNSACSEAFSIIEGQAHASYTVAGSAPAAVSANIFITVTGPRGSMRTTVLGDCLSVAMMGDILTANIDRSPHQPASSFAVPSITTSIPPALPPLSSSTTLPWTLGAIVARLLPTLKPSSRPQNSEAMNSIHCEYDFDRHTISQVKYNLSFELADSGPSSSSSPSSTAMFQLASGRHDNIPSDQFACFRLCPSLDSCPAMSLAQLLRLLNLPTDRLPPALLHSVRFDDFDTPAFATTLKVSTSTGGAVCITGTSRCGQSKRDSMQFFHRLGIATALLDESQLPSVDIKSRSPVITWLRLQCRDVLDPAVFPQLAALTAGRCLEPLYQYVLCETEGGVELSDEQRAEFETGHRLIVDHQQYEVLHPSIPLRPTNAVLALQPHLPSGYLELPLSALTALPATIAFQLPALSVLSSSSASSVPLHTTPPQCHLLVQLAACSPDLLRLCADFLDTTSILLGLQPAVHSLSAVSAALTGSTYGRRVLVARYGLWSDCGEWSGELLSEWRQSGSEWHRAHPHDVYWAAVADLQQRINRYLVRVMLQRKEDILPQLYAQPHAIVVPTLTTAPVQPGSVRPVYTHVPDVAMALLLCVPPFHSLLTLVKPYTVATDEQCALDGVLVIKGSSHHVDFASVMCTADVYTYHSGGVWALYMGPVYVWENEHTAGRGYAVDVTEPRPVQGASRRCRQLYIDDVDRLPVVRLMRDDNEGMRLYAPTLAACFEAKGVTERAEQTRAKWRRVMEQHTAAAAACSNDSLRLRQQANRTEADEGEEQAEHAERCDEEEEDDEDDEEEGSEDGEKDEESEEEEGDGEDDGEEDGAADLMDACTDGGEGFEYVIHLMNDWLRCTT